MSAEGDNRRENKTFIAAVRNGLKPAFFPRIQSDLDFLLLKLFSADSGHGHVFKDIQVYKELQQKFSEDHQQLFLLNRVHHDWLDRALEQLTGIRSRCCAACNLVTNRHVGLFCVFTCNVIIDLYVLPDSETKAWN